MIDRLKILVLKIVFSPNPTDCNKMQESIEVTP